MTAGWVLRGWSGNSSETASRLLAARYSLGWLRSEVNYHLTLPAETVKALPKALRELIGYRPYEDGRLGWYPD